MLLYVVGEITMSSSITIDSTLLTIRNDYISLIAPFRLRTLSSGVTGAGLGWHSHFINRHVDKNYAVENHVQDMQMYIESIGYNVSETVGMMTAVKLTNVAHLSYKGDDFSLFIVVTAGIGNAVDCTATYNISETKGIGTINTWIFVNAKMTDEALVQAITTATEAKTKALLDLRIEDPMSHTIATGTSTDSILIAATQQGAKLPYAGTATCLGRLIGRSIYTETKRAILYSLENGSNIKGK